MSYHCGFGRGMSVFGVEPREPFIECDGCGDTICTTKAGGLPRAWFINGKGAPGWRLVRTEPGSRRDYCPRCKD